MSELKRRNNWKRWTIMIMPYRLVLGLLVLNMVVAFPPREIRQAEPGDYDEDINKVDVEYYDELTTDEPEIEVNTLSPDEDFDPTHLASLEEEESEETLKKENGDKKELPITPSFFPSGSEGPGISMEPDTSGEEALRLTPTEILHISEDFLGSGHMLSSGGSGSSGASGIPDDRDYHSGEPLGSEGSVGLISGGSADISSGGISSEGSVDLVSGVSGAFVSGMPVDFYSEVSSGHVSGVSGHGSGTSGDFVSGQSGEFVSGTSGEYFSGIFGEIVSGVSGDFGFGVSGNFVSEVSGDFVSGVPEDFVSGVSGDFTSGVSGDFASGVSGAFFSGISGDSISDVSGEITSGVSGDFVSGVSGDFVSGASGEFVSGVSGDIVSGASGDVISGGSEEHVSGVSGDSGSGPPVVTLMPGREEEIYITTRPEEASGFPEESGEQPLLPVEPVTPGPPEEWLTFIPTLKEEEKLFSTTQTPPQEVTGSTTGSGLPESPDPDVEVIEIDMKGMNTCLLCTCLGGSVYCDDVKLVNIPPLPKDTTHFYARYNRITKINKSDFANMNKLKRIDLTSNAISKIEDGALYSLPALEELVIRENSVAQFPALPATMTLIDASHNRLGRTGIQNEAFKDMTRLLYLYLTDNDIDYIPVPLPGSLRSLHLQNNNIQMIHEDTFCKRNDLNYIRMALEDIRLDGNPVILSRTPQAYVCLPRIPVGALI